MRNFLIFIFKKNPIIKTNKILEFLDEQLEMLV